MFANTQMMGADVGFPNVCLVPTGNLAAPRSPAKAASGRASVNPQELRRRLGALHAELTSLTGTQPARWQALLGEYVQIAASLYRALSAK